MFDFNRMPRFKDHAYKIVEAIPQWAHAFHVDDVAIMRQIQIASAWVDANPKRAPRNVMRFILNWLTKAQRFGNLVDSRPIIPPSVRFAPPAEDMTVDEMREIRQQNMKRGARP